MPLEIPISMQGIGKMLQNPYVLLVLSDPQQGNYWMYETGLLRLKRAQRRLADQSAGALTVDLRYKLPPRTHCGGSR